MEANKDKGTTVGFSKVEKEKVTFYGKELKVSVVNKCEHEWDFKIEDNDKLWSKVIDRFVGIDNYADASDRQDYIETLITELKKQFTITRKQP